MPAHGHTYLEYMPSDYTAPEGYDFSSWSVDMDEIVTGEKIIVAQGVVALSA